MFPDEEGLQKGFCATVRYADNSFEGNRIEDGSGCEMAGQAYTSEVVILFKRQAKPLFL